MVGKNHIGDVWGRVFSFDSHSSSKNFVPVIFTSVLNDILLCEKEYTKLNLTKKYTGVQGYIGHQHSPNLAINNRCRDDCQFPRIKTLLQTPPLHSVGDSSMTRS